MGTLASQDETPNSPARNYAPEYERSIQDKDGLGRGPCATLFSMCVWITAILYLAPAHFALKPRQWMNQTRSTGKLRQNTPTQYRDLAKNVVFYNILFVKRKRFSMFTPFAKQWFCFNAKKMAFYPKQGKYLSKKYPKRIQIMKVHRFWASWGGST